MTFEVNGGTAVTAQTVKTGNRVAAPSDPAKTGYLFGGWYTDQGCTKAWDFNTDTVKRAVTLYAKWTANTYTVTFDPNDGVMPDGEETNRSVTYDQPYGKLPNSDGTIVLCNVRRPGAENFIDDGIVQLPLRLPHEGFPDGKCALVSAKLFREHLAGHRLAVGNEKHIHGAIADVGNEVDALHSTCCAGDGGITLRIDANVIHKNVVVLPAIGKAHLLTMKYCAAIHRWNTA